MCRENSSDSLSLPASDIGDVLKLAEVISLDQRFHTTSRQRRHGLIENRTLIRVLSTILPDRLSMKATEGVRSGFDAMQKVPPCLPDVGTSNERSPPSNRSWRIGAKAIAHRRERELPPFIFMKNANGCERT